VLVFEKLACAVKGHDWADWQYADAASCESTRTCKRDGAKETQIRHSFGEPGYVSETGCAQVKKCERCGHSEAVGLCHHFGDWQATSSPCYQERQCTRCQHKEPREAHDYQQSGPKTTVETKLGNFVVPHAVTPHTCRICGKVYLKASVR
jgi:hypothetical protein